LVPEIEVLAQRVEQRRPVVEVESVLLPVDLENDPAAPCAVCHATSSGVVPTYAREGPLTASQTAGRTGNKTQLRLDREHDGGNDYSAA
jgi:hypothetical protein